MNNKDFYDKTTKYGESLKDKVDGKSLCDLMDGYKDGYQDGYIDGARAFYKYIIDSVDNTIVGEVVELHGEYEIVIDVKDIIGLFNQFNK